MLLAPFLVASVVVKVFMYGFKVVLTVFLAIIKINEVFFREIKFLTEMTITPMKRIFMGLVTIPRNKCARTIKIR